MQELFNLILPVFGIVFSGYASRRFGLLQEASAEALNRFTYYIALPPLLFLATARVPLETILNWPFVAGYLIASLITLFVAVMGGLVFFGHRSPAVLTLHGFAAVFANTVYMGIPLFVAAFGQAGAVPAVVGAVASNLFYIGLAVLALESARHSQGGFAVAIKEVGNALIRNPILVAPSLGLAASAVQLQIPLPVERFLELLSRTAGPCALFALGLSMYGYPIYSGGKEIAWLTSIKLVIHPFITWWIVGPIMDLPPLWAASAVLLAALPSGSITFVFAQKYGIYVHRSATVVVVTTACSLLTLTMLFSWYSDTLTPMQ